MIKRFCDICQKEIKNGEDIFHLQIIKDGYVEELDRHNEMCNECRNKITQFIQDIEKGVK